MLSEELKNNNELLGNMIAEALLRDEIEVITKLDTLWNRINKVVKIK